METKLLSLKTMYYQQLGLKGSSAPSAMRGGKARRFASVRILYCVSFRFFYYNHLNQKHKTFLKKRNDGTKRISFTN